MKFQLRRLFWAFFLSSSCFLATFLWSKSLIKLETDNSSEKLAQITFTEEYSRKKLSSSLQWLPLETGDFLFDGDTVRTSDRSEVQINFNDGRSIKVDSNSTFVIQKTKDEISLDLKEGSVFVDAKSMTESANSSSLVILSNNSKIDLNGSKAQISKNKDMKTQLNIIEGKTQIKDKNGNVKELISGQAVTFGKKDIQIKEELRILSPNLTKENDKTTLFYSIDPETNSTIPFKWRGTPRSEETILLVGDSKASMAQKELIPPGKENVNTVLNAGTYYWQLVARNANSKQVSYESAVYKLIVQNRFSALVLSPKNDESLIYDKVPLNIDLKWQNPASFKSIFLEVSKSPLMASEFIINNRNVSNLQSFTLSNSGPGDYYWRLSTKYEDMDRAVYTKIQKFRVTRKEPPKPPPALTWGNTLEKQFYLQKPTIALSWDALSRKEDIAKWKIEISNSEGKTILTRDLTDIKYSNDQMKSGVYKVTLEAFDKNDLSLTKTLPKSIEILEMPFPKAPVLSVQNLKRNPTTNKFYFENGVIDLEWNFQPDAKTYEIEIFSPALNKSEKMISNKNSIQYSGAANGLNPGAYQVKITPIDQYSRRGPASEQFDFDVPNFTTLSAPKLKNLNIKQSGQ